MSGAPHWWKAGLTAAAALVMILTVAITWSNDLIDINFVNEKEYADDNAKMSKRMVSVEAAQNMMQTDITLLTENFDIYARQAMISDAVDLYRAADDALYEHRMYEARDGKTQSTTERRLALEQRKEQAREFRDCVINSLSENCIALRPQ